MAPTQTIILTIKFLDSDVELRESVRAYLFSRGVDSFSEGSQDDLDIDIDYRNPEADLFEPYAANQPFTLYGFDKAFFLDLEKNLGERFGQRLDFEFGQIETKDWQEGWKENLHPIATKVFYIYPPWLEPEASDRIPVCIEPGMAFGTGQHATTRLCVELFEDAIERHKGQSVLDVGCGSGILSIVSLKGGAATLEACDIDVDAVRATQENARENAVSLTCYHGDVSAVEPSKTFDLVFANILYVVLKDIMPDLAARLNAGGELILSGILDEQKSHMKQLAQEAGLTFSCEKQLEDWVGLAFRK